MKYENTIEIIEKCANYRFGLLSSIKDMAARYDSNMFSNPEITPGKNVTDRYLQHSKELNNEIIKNEQIIKELNEVLKLLRSLK